MQRDRFRLGKELARLQRRADSELAVSLREALQEKIARSTELAQRRAAAIPKIHYPQELPVARRREEISAAIAGHQVVILAGETGSGKTTQLPKICLELGRGIFGKIGHTQPRRLAARTVANRIAEELRVQLGEQVGYQVRFTDRVSDTTHIKLMTDGILLAEIQRDRYLNEYDTLIIDEAHERSLNIDFLLGYLKHLLPRRPDLKVIVTSATIDLERFAAHFGNAPVIEVSGRTFPVEVIYQPALEQDEFKPDDLPAAIIAAIDSIHALPRRSGANDILVFLSGERDIRDVARSLKHRNHRNTEVSPLYARLSNTEQNRVFRAHAGQRIILATNVAETSITVPGIRYVIDPGFARISRYSARSGVQRLPIEAISQASANQRKGRCGRVADGICIRLYSEEDFANRPPYTDAEILRTNLASVILQMLTLGLGEVQRFPFIDPPEARAIKAGYQLLWELGAVDKRNRITPLGRQLSRFPVDPRLGRMVIEAQRQGSLAEVLVIASGLTIQDPRERPLEKRQAADEKHRAYADPDSDFVALTNLWNVVEEQRQALTGNQFRKFCRDRFLGYLRIVEWRDIHRQLLLVARELGFKVNSEAAGYGELHRALLSGLLANVGLREDRKEYQGARNRRFHIFPGSGLFKKSPKWIMAAEIVETSKVYARAVARIEPGWIEPLARHLVTQQYSEPHWEKQRGQVVATEQVSLFGLAIARHAVDFSKTDPEVAREIFVRTALVEQQLESKVKFYNSNNKLRDDVEALEEKTRRRDILVDDDVIFEFYSARLPADICSRRTLERWVKTAPAEQVAALALSRDDLVREGAGLASLEQFPNSLVMSGVEYPLQYRFEPGASSDGVSVVVPVAALNQLSARRLEWLVPGMLRDKCIALVKALPKPQRKQLVPVPHFVDRALAEMTFGQGSLLEQLSRALQRVAGIDVVASGWSTASLEPFYKANIRVVDEQGGLLSQGRNPEELQRRLRDKVSATVAAADTTSLENNDVTRWDFGALNRCVEIDQGGVTLKVYMALVQRKDRLQFVAVESEPKAEALSYQGVVGLFMRSTPEQGRYLRKNIPRLQEMALYFAGLGSKQELVEGILTAAYQVTFLDASGLPRSAAEFEQRLARNSGELVANANRVAELVCEILRLRHEVRCRMEERAVAAWQFVYDDIEQQLQRLFEADFIIRRPFARLEQYPRYLRAIGLRLDKIQDQLAKEREWCVALEDYWLQYEQAAHRFRALDTPNPELEAFRWLLEEYRVSLYAQRLGTMEPVSSKRLSRRMAQLGISPT